MFVFISPAYAVPLQIKIIFDVQLPPLPKKSGTFRMLLGYFPLFSRARFFLFFLLFYILSCMFSGSFWCCCQNDMLLQYFFSVSLETVDLNCACPPPPPPSVRWKKGRTRQVRIGPALFETCLYTLGQRGARARRLEVRYSSASQETKVCDIELLSTC